MKRPIKILLGSALSLITLSAIFDLNKETKNIQKRIFNKLSYSKDQSNADKDKYWAKEILNGGYILYFRHAERDKWIDVQIYDALESDLQNNGLNGTRYAETDYFENAVCLNERGKIQAKSISEVIKFSKLPIGYVVTSPSCRARQTADIAFGGYDDMKRTLVHKGPYYEVGDRNSFLIKFIKNLPLDKDKNTIISAHNGVINYGLFSNRRFFGEGEGLGLEEGGFYIISKNEKQNKLRLEHEFHNFKDFSKFFFVRNHD
tara:strand:- start:727 stop:1506 length:780 start_codon:yes stop_codon:yes gene_type:complete